MGTRLESPLAIGYSLFAMKWEDFASLARELPKALAKTFAGA
jgi:hypothetical protein